MPVPFGLPGEVHGSAVKADDRDDNFATYQQMLHALKLCLR
ncbi:hypothetical protein [Thalassomonas haliotis]|nr:hypothetical protein [Thalassomonas haliotis]